MDSIDSRCISKTIFQCLETFVEWLLSQAIQWNVNFFWCGRCKWLETCVSAIMMISEKQIRVRSETRIFVCCASNLINSFSHAKRGKMSNYSRKNLIKRPSFFCFSFLFPVLNCIVTMPNKSLQSILKKESVGSILWTNVWTINLF